MALAQPLHLWWCNKSTIWLRLRCGPAMMQPTFGSTGGGIGIGGIGIAFLNCQHKWLQVESSAPPHSSLLLPLGDDYITSFDCQNSVQIPAPIGKTQCGYSYRARFPAPNQSLYYSGQCKTFCMNHLPWSSQLRVRIREDLSPMGGVPKCNRGAHLGTSPMGPRSTLTLRVSGHWKAQGSSPCISAASALRHHVQQTDFQGIGSAVTCLSGP